MGERREEEGRITGVVGEIGEVAVEEEEEEGGVVEEDKKKGEEVRRGERGERGEETVSG